MFLLYYDYICKVVYSTSLRQALDLCRFACKELTYEIENPDIKDEFTIKF